MAFCLFKHVNEATASALRASSSSAGAGEIIRKSTKLLSETLTPAQQAVEVELFVNQTRFCLEEKFDVRQISSYLSIIRDTLSYGIDHRASEGVAWKFFESQVLAHAADRPPFAINVFRFEELRAIFAFAKTIFFRLYPVYLTVFLPEIHLETSSCARGEEPQPPQELTEAEKIEKELIYDFRQPPAATVDESALIEAVYLKYAK